MKPVYDKEKKEKKWNLLYCHCSNIIYFHLVCQPQKDLLATVNSQNRHNNEYFKFSAILFPGFSLTRSQGFFCTHSQESNPRTKLVFEQRQTQVKSPFTFASCLPLVNCYKFIN